MDAVSTRCWQPALLLRIGDGRQLCRFSVSIPLVTVAWLLWDMLTPGEGRAPQHRPAKKKATRADADQRSKPTTRKGEMRERRQRQCRCGIGLGKPPSVPRRC